jgi:Stress responsive A/B Barrel Domain
MLRHVLLFRWTEDSSEEDRAAAVQALRALDQQIPELRRLAVTEGLKLNPGSYDGLLEAEFDDEAGYGQYVKAESHQEAWLHRLQPVCAELATIQLGS